MKKILFSITILGILFIASSCGCHNNNTSSSMNDISSNEISSNESTSSSNDSISENSLEESLESTLSINELSIQMK